MASYVASDGAELHYDLLGVHGLPVGGSSGRAAIVVLAGGAARHPSYLGDLAGLASGRALVVPHLRGVGRSPAPALTESGAFWRQAGDIEALRVHLGVDQILVVAHSAGTRLAIAYAARYAARVAGLLLITPPAGYLVDDASDVDSLIDARRGDPAFDAALAALSAGPDGSTEDAFNAWQQVVAPAGYATWAAGEQAHARVGRWNLAAARAYFGVEPPSDLPAQLRTVDAPVLVIAGAQDCFTGVAPVMALAALFPNGSCVVIDRCGHYPWIEQPGAFRSAADAFLDAVDPRAWPVAESVETTRLVLEPLNVAHTAELVRVLDDERLHEFIGGRPATRTEMSARVARQVRGASGDGSQGWCNWVVRHRRSGSAVGTVQATIQAEPERVVAEIAWVIASPHQLQGFASEAATGMAHWLFAHGVDVLVAHVHPDHQGSNGVARRVGLAPTAVMVDGEVCWSTAPETTHLG
ncbi:alpha/beta fold hydrolase [Pengzhenrongella frigida]|uniref:Alpha/beta fold hydrolase n=1 Tax=Pengzhenrongella frigida TaxID=1259133 RepID=A0A4Q5N368_9MICO|nr:alpha/beta fold hydrolase [Cellulomonas sp. HLT2-17]RYV52659.1 alpha/beta fold hydrolase [Cellulomonas sp. HLT2-17]